MSMISRVSGDNLTDNRVDFKKRVRTEGMEAK